VFSSCDLIPKKMELARSSDSASIMISPMMLRAVATQHSQCCALTAT